MHNHRGHTPSGLSASAHRITDEPGFITMEIGASWQIPGTSAGLLAFVYEYGEKQTVIRIMLMDNLAQGYVDNRPFCGRANRIVFFGFPDLANVRNHSVELENRLKLYAELTKKYQSQQMGS